ncbi:MAG: hypothetical protein M1827_004687 [Pycnora praestabilis]|nr:MAG: hypothetical protein M1827_004687 [Pycnora praestabilis]
MPRRGASTSRVYLTKRNGPKTHLLQSLPNRSGGKHDGEATRRSPATDDEPKSSSDELSELDLPIASSSNSTTVPHVGRRLPAVRVPQKGLKILKPTSQDAQTEDGVYTVGAAAGSRSIKAPNAASPPRRSTRRNNPPSSSPKRSIDEVEDGGVDLLDDFGFVGSSQTRKKVKRPRPYGKVLANIHAHQAAETPDVFGSKPGSKASEGLSRGSYDPNSVDGTGFRDPLERKRELEAKLQNLPNSPEILFRVPRTLSRGGSGTTKGSEGTDQAAHFLPPGDGTPAFRVHAACSAPESNSSEDDGDCQSRMRPSLTSENSGERNGDLHEAMMRLSRSRSGLMEEPVRTDVTRTAEKILTNTAGRHGTYNEKQPLTSSTASSSVPSGIVDEEALSDSSSLSSLPESPIFGSSQEDPELFGADIPSYKVSSVSRCPMCKEKVDLDFLEEFDNGKRMNVRKQAQFCRAHKQRTAKKDWQSRGYPDIDWHNFDTRIRRFQSSLDDLLECRKPSFYRNALESSVRGGRNRTLAQSIMSGDFHGLTPGYYGSRGARVMMESIMSIFSSKIRKLASTDKIISSGGVSGYVQVVLVPELAVMLVKEDMRLDDEEARAVLRDSIDVGDLLNEEENDDPRPVLLIDEDPEVLSV